MIGWSGSHTDRQCTLCYTMRYQAWYYLPGMVPLLRTWYLYYIPGMYEVWYMIRIYVCICTHHTYDMLLVRKPFLSTAVIHTRSILQPGMLGSTAAIHIRSILFIYGVYLTRNVDLIYAVLYCTAEPYCYTWCCCMPVSRISWDLVSFGTKYNIIHIVTVPRVSLLSRLCHTYTSKDQCILLLYQESKQLLYF